jgi:4-hydroxy-3-methylbut-2-enyl diphosphate reductase
VETAEQSAPAMTLGPIIHNPQVVEDLARMGVSSADEPASIPPGSRVVIRSHGVGSDVYRALQARSCRIVDATCPFVQRIHDMARAASASQTPLIVIGESDHPEVQGTAGWSRRPVHVVFTTEDVERLPQLSKALVVSQTTIPEEKWEELLPLLRHPCWSPHQWQ